MGFTSPLPSVSPPASPLTPYILERASRLADKAAFIDGATGRAMTYGEFEESVRRQAGGWLDSGLVKGEVVALMAPNCPEYGVVFHAVALAGGALTTVNPTYTPGEVHHQLVDSGATRLVTIPMLLETATAAIADSAVKEVYVIGDADGYASIASLASAPLAEQVPVELVTDYLEGALAPCRRARFEQHLAACPFCVTYVEQIRQIITTASAVAPQRLSSAAQQRLLRAFRGWHSLEPPPPHESG